jgi:hypothetical protein
MGKQGTNFNPINPGSILNVLYLRFLLHGQVMIQQEARYAKLELKSRKVYFLLSSLAMMLKIMT